MSTDPSVTQTVSSSAQSGYPEFWDVPQDERHLFHPKTSRFVVLIPVINEQSKLFKQLERMRECGIPEMADIVVCDGDSTDGTADPERLRQFNIRGLLIKKGPGKLSAQLRMGMAFGLIENYEGILTIDGNGKDSVESIPAFIQRLEEGYDFVQGSRFIPGGKAIRTPWLRWFAIRFIHAPWISLLARHWFTDTTNGFRGHSQRYLNHPQVQPFRGVFDRYELLAYLSVRSSQLGLKVIETPVSRVYPESGPIPTKIKGFRGNWDLIQVLINLTLGRYNPN